MGEPTEGLENLTAVVERVEDYFKNPEKWDLKALLTVTKKVCLVLEKTLMNLCKRIEDRHRIIDGSQKQKQILVTHYTSIANIVSMLQEASNHNKAHLRLYNSVHFNDPGEDNYLHNLLLSNLHNFLEDHKWLGKTDARPPYIASFILPDCQEPEEKMRDNLIFWRTYGQEGEGVSLSLEAPLSRLRKVLYGLQEAERTVEEIRSVLATVLTILDPLEIDRPSVPEEIRRTLTDTVWKHLEKIRYLYKDDAYEHEKECRCVVLESNIKGEDKKFEYRCRNNNSPRIQHYYEDKCFELKKLMVSDSCITLGPCVPHREDVKHCITTLMKRANWSSEIRNSHISYRKT